jgi:hypothetical protein
MGQGGKAYQRQCNSLEYNSQALFSYCWAPKAAKKGQTRVPGSDSLSEGNGGNGEGRERRMVAVRRLEELAAADGLPFQEAMEMGPGEGPAY